MSSVKVIGICGGIGSGKSVVSRILRTQGYHVYDCDLEARNLMGADINMLAEFQNRWGKEILTIEGEPDRRRIAEIVFSDSAELAWLNNIVHESVRVHLRGWLNQWGDEKPVFVESAILGSSGLSKFCDEIWEITAPMDVRLARLETRSGMSAEEAISRIKSQEAEAELIRATGCPVKVIVNDGDLSLIEQLPIIDR